MSPLIESDNWYMIYLTVAFCKSRCAASQPSELSLTQLESFLTSLCTGWRHGALETSITGWSVNIIRKKSQDVCETLVLSIQALLNHVSWASSCHGARSAFLTHWFPSWTRVTASAPRVVFLIFMREDVVLAINPPLPVLIQLTKG